MNRACSALAGGVVVLVTALPVSADAPIGQYRTFNSENSTVTDAFTQLEWDRNVRNHPARMSFEDASDACAAAGKRLPTLKELLTIVDEEPYFEYVNLSNSPRYIDGSAFDDSQPDPYWSSSLVSASEAYTVDFKTGFVGNAGLGDARNVRCVK